MLRTRSGAAAPARRVRAHGWILGMPLKMRFKRSNMYLR